MKFILSVLFLFSFALDVQAYPVSKITNELVVVDAVIANGGTTSAAVDLGGYTLVGLRVATMTGVAITYTMSDTFGGTYVAVHNSSGAVSTTVGDDLYYAVSPDNFRGLQFIKLVSGSAEGAERTVKLYLRKL
jgi:hypothetical protein